MKRRSFVKWLGAVLAALPINRARLLAQGDGLPVEAVATLRAVAALVLPASLGRGRTDEIADRFVRWMRNYRAGAEMDHGYGFPRLRVTDRSPAAGYRSHLSRLEHDARARGASFAELAPEGQRAIIEASLGAAKIETLPARPGGRHIVADLMAFYFRSAEANDLCYRAEIGRDDCRDLQGSSEPPKVITKNRFPARPPDHASV